jgi:outer membrane protein TolC
MSLELQMNFRTAYLLCLFLFPMGVPTALGQSTDSTLSQETFLNLVRTFHPVARQASILVDRADANLTTARAGFDPVLSVDAERKTFDGKYYYEHVNPELRIPTWYGVEFAGGLERNLGDLLNPELSRGRSSYLGVSIPIAKNLLMDKRRAILRQAKIFRDQSIWERRLAINDLLHEAAKSYWNWVQADQVERLLANAVEVSLQRLRLVRSGYQQGDRPAIDTTEALTQLQAFQLSLNEAILNLAKARLELSDFLWKTNDEPWYLPPGIGPDSIAISVSLSSTMAPELVSTLETAMREHPKLKILDFKLRSMEVDRQLKFQDLLPKVDLKYNLLSKGYATPLHAGIEPFRNDFKFGLGVAMPLRLSQGRGLYREAGLKIRETRLGQSQTVWEIENKIRYQHAAVIQLGEQWRQAREYVRNHEQLWRAEELKFRMGESTLFLVNSRENKLLEAREKLVSVQVKYLSAFVSFQWAAGQLR